MLWVAICLCTLLQYTEAGSKNHISPFPVAVVGAEYSDQTFDYALTPVSPERYRSRLYGDTSGAAVDQGRADLWNGKSISSGGIFTHQPLVSIVTSVCDPNPVYLNATATSILRQTFADFEWVLVDDSTTNSESLQFLKHFRQHSDPRVRFLSCPISRKANVREGLYNERCGPSKTRNYALRSVYSRYLMFIDDDDLIENTFVEKGVWLLESAPRFAFVGSMVVGFQSKNYTWHHTWYESNLRKNQHTITAIFRVSVLKMETDWPFVYDETITKGGEDWKLFCELQANGFFGVTIEEFLFWYRIKPRRRNWNFLQGRKNEIRDSRVLPEGTKFHYLESLQEYPQLHRRGHSNPHIGTCKFCVDTAPPPGREPRHVKTLRDALSLRQNVAVFLIQGFTPNLRYAREDLQMLRTLVEKGWNVIVVCFTAPHHSMSGSASSSTESLRAEFQRYTNEIFVLPIFLRIRSYPRFISHLLHSRRADVLLISRVFAGYKLLPYLQLNYPHVVYIDMQSAVSSMRHRSDNPAAASGKMVRGSDDHLQNFLVDSHTSDLLDLSIVFPEEHAGLQSSTAAQSNDKVYLLLNLADVTRDISSIWEKAKTNSLSRRARSGDRDVKIIAGLTQNMADIFTDLLKSGHQNIFSHRLNELAAAVKRKEASEDFKALMLALFFYSGILVILLVACQIFAKLRRPTRRRISALFWKVWSSRTV